MSPDEPCTPGKYCPYACPPGQLMNQWDPDAKAYTYPASMNGGLKCDKDGKVTTPFGDRPLCVDGEGTVSIDNKADKNVAFCQTVLPGNEAMLIPTNCAGKLTQVLAVPGPSYWASTGAHYYINTPGISTTDACVWGTKSKAQGNWSPYVAGMNMDKSGSTFVTVGWNPKYQDDFNHEKPNFGVRITCDKKDACLGLPCEIQPDSGKSLFCVVTATKNAKAKIEVFDA